MFAQREDRVAAQAVGIRVMDPRLLAFVVGAFFSAVAGSLYAHFITSFSPTVFYFDLTFRVITMLVIGGMGSVSGSILGAILIVGLGEALRRVEDATLLYGLSSIVLAVIFIVVITVRREGLLGQREVPLDRLFDRDWWRRRREPPRPTPTPRAIRARRPRSELRHRIRSAQSSAVRSSIAPSAMCSSRTRPSARRPSRAPTQYSSGTSEASVLNRILLAGREAEQLAGDLGRLAGREQDRLAHVGVDVREHRREVGERADVRVAGVEQHDRRGPEAIAKKISRSAAGSTLVRSRSGSPRPGVELDRDALPGRLLDGDDDRGGRAAASTRSGAGPSRRPLLVDVGERRGRGRRGRRPRRWSPVR